MTARMSQTAGDPKPRPLGELVDEARRLDMGSVHILAWRDLDDPEAGGSELHAHRIASLWAAAGLEVTMRASRAEGHPMFTERDGYRVVRKSGRYAVFARSALSGTFRRHGRNDGWVEIWNGMPFFSPLWATGPRVVFLHHVHAEMWQMTLPPNLARAGRFVEQTLAPPLYRRTSLVTLSESSRTEIVSMLKMRPGRVNVVPPGVEPRFTPGGERSPSPLVVAVGRLVPVKRFDALLDALAKVRIDHPGMRAVIVGEGYERERLEARRHELGADDWIDMPGKLSDDELVDIYRRAWVLVERVAARGMGDDGHRGRSLRHARGRHPDRRTRRRCGAWRERAVGRRSRRHCGGGFGAHHGSGAPRRARQRRCPSRGQVHVGGDCEWDPRRPRRRGTEASPGSLTVLWERTRSASASAPSSRTAREVMNAAGSNWPGHVAPAA